MPCHAIGTGADVRNKSGPLLNGIEGRKMRNRDRLQLFRSEQESRLYLERGDLSGLEAKILGTKKLFAGIKDVTRPAICGPISDSSAPMAGRNDQRAISLSADLPVSWQLAREKRPVPRNLSANRTRRSADVHQAAVYRGA